MLDCAGLSKHVRLAIEYAQGVESGEIDNCKWVKAACKKFLTCLERSKKKSDKYTFDAAEGERVCRLAEMFPHVKGKWGAKREYIVLEPWQCFVLVNIFAWKEKKTGLRKIRRVYLKIPRKNGKSVLAAVIGNIMFAADGEFGAEIYCGATTEKQAWEVFRPAKLMLQKASGFAEAFGISVMAKSMVIDADGSRFEPVIGKPGDGSSPSCAIIDEFHEHKTPEMLDTMQTGMGAREEPLLLVITTAGADIASPCFLMESEAQSVLDETIEGEDLFACMWGIDAGDDWSSPKILKKANPNYGVSVFADFLIRQQKDALALAEKQTKFKTKHLNVWVSEKDSLFNVESFKRCADPMLEIDELLGCEAFTALDMGTKSDLCAESTIFRKEIGGKPHYYLFSRYWLPEAAVDEPGPNQMAYRKWHALGMLKVTDGAAIDFAVVQSDLVDRIKQVNSTEFIFDPFNATQTSQAVMDVGVTAIEFTQDPKNFAVPMDDLQTAIKDGRFHYDGNELTLWCFTNVVGRPTRKGFMAPTKSVPHKKIDGAISAIMAMSRAAAEDNDSGIFSNGAFVSV